MFHPHDPRTVCVEEVLTELRDVRLRAEVACLHGCLLRRDAVAKHESEIRRMEMDLIRNRFHMEMDLASVRKRLQYARAIPKISEKYDELQAKYLCPRHSPDPTPIPPCTGGPCEMPCLQGEGSKQPHKCFQCKSTNHLIAQCPQRRAKQPCQWCGSRTHQYEVCLIRHISPMSPAYIDLDDHPWWCVPVEDDWYYTSD
ncbi:hypothetical protein EDB92DRAFT_1812883 [Lactarius akahatsu]|uniref:CCHC-type domain-containing protein n=1 Tax=Lactarius akahatsu TaxID=416441 RepID=A0AAD4LPZ6_9AGAM|nr:hypothetical protein EDB92DRAFT_1812883 [Lactarius akahatsu]